MKDQQRITNESLLSRIRELEDQLHIHKVALSLATEFMFDYEQSSTIAKLKEKHQKIDEQFKEYSANYRHSFHAYDIDGRFVWDRDLSDADDIIQAQFEEY